MPGTADPHTDRRRVVWADLQLARFAVFGCGTGLLVDSALYPAEVIKTRLQVASAPDASSLLVGHDVRSGHDRPIFHAGGVSGAHTVAGDLEGHVRARQSTTGVNSGKIYTSLWDCVRKTYRGEGVRGFYGGFGAAALASVPMQVISYGGYEFTKHEMETYLFDRRRRAGFASSSRESSPAGSRQNERNEPSAAEFYPTDTDKSGTVASESDEDLTPQEEMVVDLVAGAVGEVASAVVWVPADIVTQKLQLQGPNSAEHRFSGGWDCFTQILKHEGVAGIYRGMGPTMATYVPSTAAQFMGYQQFKRLLYLLPGLRGGEQESHFVNLTAGALAGALAACVANPLDVVKTRVQTQNFSAMRHYFHAIGMKQRHDYPTISPRYRSTMQGMRLIIREEGFRALGAGMSARVLAMAPYSAISFGVYELIKLMSLKPPDVND